MKRTARLVLTLVILFSAFGAASASYSPPDLYDTFTMEPSSSDTDGSNNPTLGYFRVTDQLNITTSACEDSEVTYFVFDASEIATATSASLVLTRGGTFNGSDSSPVLSLYGVEDFDRATLNGLNNPHPLAADLIQSIVMTAAEYPAASKITFNSGLAGYIQEQVDAGDHTITLALSFSGSCSLISQVNFYSLDYTTNPTYRPQLTIEGTKPTAVTLATSSAETVTWPLYAGLGAVALVVIAGLAVSRRRTA